MPPLKVFQASALPSQPVTSIEKSILHFLMESYRHVKTYHRPLPPALPLERR